MMVRIIETPTFKSLDFVQREMTLKKTCRLVIENGYKVAKHLGYEAWEKQSGFSSRNKNIVKELLEQDKIM